jgi:Domain of unknown function (DUF4412)
MKTRTFLLLLAFIIALPSAMNGQVGNLLKNKMSRVINAGTKTANKEVDNKIDSAATKETEKRIALEKEKAAEAAKNDSINNAGQPSKAEGDKASSGSQPSGGINFGKLMANKVTLKYNEDYNFGSRIYMQTETYNKQDVTKMDFFMYYSASTPGVGIETKSIANQDGNATPVAASMVMDVENKSFIMLTNMNGMKMGIISPIPDENTATTQPDGKPAKNVTPPTFTKTGNTRTIAGYKCDEYSYVSNQDKTTGKVWFTKDAKLKIDKRGWQKTGMATYYGSTAFSDGIILGSETYDDKGKMTMKSETKEIDENFPYSISVKGYSLRQMNMGQKK